MKITTIRDQFTSFFEKKGHKKLPAAPLVAKNNPSLLFVNAGMNPFAGIFLGEEAPAHLRVANSQPCLRVTGKHNDLEDVGHDTYHHTLFEMLGNWSFGDYFQEEAISWAWELLTNVYNLPQDRLYATVFEGAHDENLSSDSASFKLWKNYLPDSRILYGNKKDNFWEMGATGPCGPSSELHIDLRSEKERKMIPGRELVNKDHPEVIELWNLVFITHHRQANQKLQKLSNQYVDTGMGLERLAMALQGKRATYDTDAFSPYLAWLSDKTKLAYGEDTSVDCAMRVIADHLRAIAFVIADGQRPSTQKAGYVLRRILRRAVRYGHSYLNIKEPFLCEMVPLFTKMFGEAYPHVTQQASFVAQTIQQEEVSFLRTLSSGLKRLYVSFEGLPKGSKMAGQTLFELYDTYGFPPDLTALILREKGYQFDQAGFDEAMAKQKERGKKATQRDVGDWHVLSDDAKESEFVGYDALETTSRIVKYRTITTQAEESYQLVLDKTPFYPEGGGQIGDTGVLQWDSQEIAVLDTQREHNLIVHYTKKLPSNPALPCTSKVDAKRRKSTERNHTATHLMGSALEQVLGKHVAQKGSLVHPDALRFDFAHPKKLTDEELKQVASIVNEKIRENIPLIEHRNMPIEEAKAMGATALFEDKYADKVRVVSFGGEFSTELCGGTHLAHTGEIGYFYFRSQGPVGTGIRRVEALTGEAAQHAIQENQEKLSALSTLLNSPKDLLQATETLVKEHKKLQKNAQTLLKKEQKAMIDRLAIQIEEHPNLHLLVQRVEAPNLEFLKKLTFALKARHSDAFVALGALVDKKPNIVIALGNNLQEGYDANASIQAILPLIQGRGGGKASLAIARGEDAQGLQSALEKIAQTALL